MDMSLIASRDPVVIEQGFHSSWPIKQVSIEIAKSWLKHNVSEGKNFIWDLTWSWPENSSRTKAELETLNELGQFDHAVLYNFIDNDTNFTEQTAKILRNNAKKIYAIGNIQKELNNTVYIETMPILVRELFKKYSLAQVQPKEFSNIYLSYNRKPHNHRIQLYNEFFQRSLFDKGVFTFNKEPDTSDLDLPDERLIKEEKLDQPDQWIYGTSPYSSPEDSRTLGDLEYWNSFFLNIVTETTWSTENCYEDWEYPRNIFVSEKTFKPILGLRPFFIIGDRYINEWLLERGFKNFNQYFGFAPDYNVTISEIADVVESLTLKNCEILYKDMQSDLLHNYNRFPEFVNEVCIKHNLKEFIR